LWTGNWDWNILGMFIMDYRSALYSLNYLSIGD
jgi:hypothetical protein